MRIFTTINGLRRMLAEHRRQGQRIVLVPTMGNLHAGHLSLVERAHQLGERVVVSIFVNPLQFGRNEDLARYPQTPREDRRRLRRAGVHCLFAPSDQEMHPHGHEITRVQVPGLGDILCGASRPGHFDGVATVVTRLFQIVAPQAAVFGSKDYQQLLVIRRMVRDLVMPVRIHAQPTVREADGLALSSRNQYLDPEQRHRAPQLYRSLLMVRRQLHEGLDPAQATRRAREHLQRRGFVVDYLEIRESDTLSYISPQSRSAVVLAAASLGNTRLIDNLRIRLQPSLQPNRGKATIRRSSAPLDNPESR